MTSIGPSQSFKNLVNDYKKANANEASNIINQDEANSIKAKLMEETKGLSETQTAAFMKEAESFLNSAFTGTNVSSKFELSDGSKDVNKPTSFKFDIKGKVETKKEVPVQSQLVADGKDFNKEERKQLQGNPKGEDIIKRYDFLAEKPTRSLTGDVTKLNSASKEDLQGLYETFGDDAQKFLNALKANPRFQTATLKDCETILKFAKEGCKSKDDVIKLQQSLKNIGPDLKARFEKNGADIGQGKGIDGEYGFATMEGVRYLSSVMKSQQPQNEVQVSEVSTSGEVSSMDQDFTSLIPDDRQVMIAVDVRGSMNADDRSTLNKYDEVVKDHSKSDIGFMVFNSNSGATSSAGQVLFKPGGSDKTVEKEQKNLEKAQNKFNQAQERKNKADENFTKIDAEWKALTGPAKAEKYKERLAAQSERTSASSELTQAKTELRLAESELKAKKKSIVSNAIQNSNGTHAESGSKAALGCMDQMNPAGKKPHIIVQTDEPDKSPESMKNLMQKGLDGKIDPKSVVFYNPETKENMTLQSLLDKVTTNGKIDDSKFNQRMVKQEGNSFAIFDSQLALPKVYK